jgi:hypothetical protein
MSNQPPRRIPVQRFVAEPNDPAELERLTEANRRYRKTAAGQVGCFMVIDAPLPLLAQFIAELAPADRQEFLTELVARLPAEVLRPLAEAVAARRDLPAAEG